MKESAPPPAVAAWRAAMVERVMALIAALPLPVVHAIGGWLGHLVYWLSPTYRRRLVANLQQAGYSDRATRRAAIAEAGRQMFETPWVWRRPAAQLQARVFVDNDEVLSEVLAEPRPLILLTPHLGCFEVTAKYYAQRRPEAAARPLTILYRVPKKPVLRPLVQNGRAEANIRLAPAELRGVRMLISALRTGGAAGILPDQVPSQGEGIWAPFFGRLAYTMTLPVRLAGQHDANLCLAWAERLPRGRGWRMRFVRLPRSSGRDVAAETARLNRAIEDLVRLRPEQYLWGYNRYKRPSGAPPPEGEY